MSAKPEQPVVYIRPLNLRELQMRVAQTYPLSNLPKAFISLASDLEGGAHLRHSTFVTDSLIEEARLEQVSALAEVMIFFKRYEAIGLSVENLKQDTLLLQKVFNHCSRFQELDDTFELDSNLVLSLITGDEFYRLLDLQIWLAKSGFQEDGETLIVIDEALHYLATTIFEQGAVLEQALISINESPVIDARLANNVEDVLSFFEKNPYPISPSPRF